MSHLMETETWKNTTYFVDFWCPQQQKASVYEWRLKAGHIIMRPQIELQSDFDSGLTYLADHNVEWKRNHNVWLRTACVVFLAQ